MIKRISHLTILVRDQQEALKFYTEKLGLVVKNDTPMGDNERWLTLGIPAQPEIEIILQLPQWGPDSTPEARAALVGKTPGFLFEVDDCRQRYEELKAKGVQFTGEPQDYPWGTQVFFTDVDGTLHSLSSPPKN